MPPTPQIAEGPFVELFRAEPCPVEWAFGVGGTVVREMDGRRTTRVVVDGGTYFVKTYAGAPPREVLKNWLSLRGASGSAAGEVRAHRAAEAAGIPVPRMVAAGSRGRRSFIVTEDVGTQDTVGSRLGELLAMGPRVRHGMIEAVGQLVGRLHGAGINHRDCYLVHIALTDFPPGVESGGSSGALCLMDLHRAGVRRRVPRRWVAKDLGGLAFSAEAARLSRADRLRFARAYAGAGGEPSAALRAQVERRVAALVRERARKGARFGR